MMRRVSRPPITLAVTQADGLARLLPSTCTLLHRLLPMKMLVLVLIYLSHHRRLSLKRKLLSRNRSSLKSKSSSRSKLLSRSKFSSREHHPPRPRFRRCRSRQTNGSHLRLLSQWLHLYQHLPQCRSPFLAPVFTALDLLQAINSSSSLLLRHLPRRVVPLHPMLLFSPLLHL